MTGNPDLHFRTTFSLSDPGVDVGEELAGFEWPGHTRIILDGATVVFRTTDSLRHLPPPNSAFIWTATEFTVDDHGARGCTVTMAQTVSGPWHTAQTQDPEGWFSDNFDEDVEVWIQALKKALNSKPREIGPRERSVDDIVVEGRELRAKERKETQRRVRTERQRMLEDGRRRDLAQYQREQRERALEEHDRLTRWRDDRRWDDRGIGGREL